MEKPLFGCNLPHFVMICPMHAIWELKFRLVPIYKNISMLYIKFLNMKNLMKLLIDYMYFSILIILSFLLN